MRRRTPVLRLPVLAATLIAVPSPAQCPPNWIPGFHADDLPAPVNDATVFDDGTGPALYVGLGAGGLTGDPRVLRWTGAQWSPVATLPAVRVSALAALDPDGAGPLPQSLFAGVQGTSAPSSGVYQLTESGWLLVGPVISGPFGGDIESLAAHDPDGTGPQHAVLVAGGVFAGVGGVAATNLTVWNGEAWAPLPPIPTLSGPVLALESFDPDGPGAPLLVAGGEFSPSLWNGSTWTTTPRFSTTTYAFTTWDPDGPGGPAPAELFAAGGDPPGSAFRGKVRRWTGADWLPLGPGPADADNYVTSLAAWDPDGPSGPHPSALYAGGAFTQMAGRPAGGVATWDGAAWSAAGDGFRTSPSGPYTRVSALVPVPAEAGFGSPLLFAGGTIDRTPTLDIRYGALWDGAAWARIGATSIPGGEVRAFARFDPDGPGPGPASLCIAGDFISVAGVPAVGIAAREADGPWSALGQGLTGVRASAEFDQDGDGPAPPSLIAGGWFSSAGSPATYAARWDGGSWSSMDAGLSGPVNDLLVWDQDGAGPAAPTAFACGDYVARWTGSQWESLGATPGGSVSRLIVFDPDADGPTEPSLHAFGWFESIGGAAAISAARWDGKGWAPIPGFDPLDYVPDVAVWDPDADGPLDPVLVASIVEFEWTEEAHNSLRTWDGSSWTPVPGLAIQYTGSYFGFVIEVHDEDGPGPAPAALYAAGPFTQAGGQPSAGIARFDGAAWSPLGAGVSPGALVRTMLSFDADRAGPGLPVLYLGGLFRSAGGIASMRLAAWGPAPDITIAEHPADAAVRSGQPAIFSVTVASPHGLAYQWRRDGIPLTDTPPYTGAATPVLSITPALPVHRGSYDCVISDPCGPVTTHPATLAITCPADWNGSGPVDSADISAFVASWLESLQGADTAADFNADGVVNSADLSAFLMAWLGALSGGC